MIVRPATLPGWVEALQGCAQADDVERVLADIDADRGDFAVEFL